MSDTVRVIRIIEYVGPREWVEAQLAHSIHGKKQVHDDSYIQVTTLGEYPEIIERESVEATQAAPYRYGAVAEGGGLKWYFAGASFKNVEHLVHTRFPDCPTPGTFEAVEFEAHTRETEVLEGTSITVSYEDTWAARDAR